MIEKRTTKVKATTKAVAFTGHREISHNHQEQVRERLKDAVLQAIHQGANKFYCGMALGFDMMAAEEVLSLKLSIPMLKLIAVVPFKGQSASWSMVEQQRYAYILSKADDVVHLSEDYFNGCYFKRNDYMLSHSGSVIAYFDGKPKGGTAYTCRKAYWYQKSGSHLQKQAESRS